MRSVRRDLNGFFGKSQIDTTYTARNSGDNTPAWRSVVDYSLEGVAPERHQDGGELSRREALRLGRENKGFNRSQARFAYQNAKNTLRNAGASGREMRQTARQ